MTDARAYPDRPIVGVGAVILIARDSPAAAGYRELGADVGVVLVKRGHAPLKGQWSLPGGAVEVGETLEQAVAREVQEECGLEVEVGPVVDVFDRILLDGSGRVEYHFVLVDYLCRSRGGVLRAGSDVDEVAIADPERLASYALTAKAAEVIGKAMEHAVEK